MKSFHQIVVGLLLASFLLTACGDITPTPDTDTTPTPGTELTPIDLQVGYGVRGSWFELYFTDPANPFSSQGTGGVDGPLVEAIDAARLSIDIAAYSISLNSVRYALIRAHDRGVNVRIVMESSNMDPQAKDDQGDLSIAPDYRLVGPHERWSSPVWLQSSAERALRFLSFLPRLV